MNKFKRSALALGTIFAVLLFGASSAMAQNDEVREISFEDDLIEGELLSPNGSNTGVLIDEDTSSLIKVREDFVGEMVKSGEGL